MDSSMRMLRLLVLIPVLTMSTSLAMTASALLNDGGVLYVGLGVLVGVLATGRLEPPTVKLLARARPVSEAEHSVLAPVWTQLSTQAVPTGDVYVARAPREAAVTVWGRRSLVLDPRVVDALHRGAVRVDEAAGLVGHAVGRRRAGPARFDLALAVWSLPWRLVWTMARVVAAAFSWVPLAGACWRLRIMLLPGLIYQASTQPRLWWYAVGAMVLLGLTYVCPWADRSWRGRVEDRADQYVVEHGLGEGLATLLQRRGASLERLYRLRVHPRASLRAVPASA